MPKLFPLAIICIWIGWGSSMIASDELALQNLTDAEFAQLSELMRELGKIERRDLFVPVARLQLLHVMDRIQAMDPNDAKTVEATQFARGVAFNIASFTWPGWGDTPNITPEMEKLGESAALFGLKLARQIADVTSNILWINGVHALNARKYEAATSYFTEAKTLVDKEPYATMHEAWLRCTVYLQDPSAENKNRLTSVLTQLEQTPGDEGSFFKQQIETALPILLVP